MIYEALAGGLPHARKTPIEIVVAKQLHAARPLAEVAPEVSRTVADVVMRTLAKEPAARFSSCRAFADAFAAAMAPNVIVAAPPLPPRPVREARPLDDEPPARSRKKMLVVGAIAVLAAGAIAFTVTRPKAPDDLGARSVADERGGR